MKYGFRKEQKGASRIYSLEEYKDVARFDKKIDKAYLEEDLAQLPK